MDIDAVNFSNFLNLGWGYNTSYLESPLTSRNSFAQIKVQSIVLKYTNMSIPTNTYILKYKHIIQTHINALAFRFHKIPSDQGIYECHMSTFSTCFYSYYKHSHYKFIGFKRKASWVQEGKGRPGKNIF